MASLGLFSLTMIFDHDLFSESVASSALWPLLIELHLLATLHTLAKQVKVKYRFSMIKKSLTAFTVEWGSDAESRIFLLGAFPGFILHRFG